MKLITEEKLNLLNEIETLEPRIVPGTLIVKPLGITDGTSNTIQTTKPNFGLTMAQQRTGGVITWTSD